MSEESWWNIGEIQGKLSSVLTTPPSAPPTPYTNLHLMSESLAICKPLGLNGELHLDTAPTQRASPRFEQRVAPSGVADRGEERTDRGEERTDRGEERTDRGEERTDRGEERTDRGEERTDRGEERTDRGEERTDRGEERTDSTHCTHNCT